MTSLVTWETSLRVMKRPEKMLTANEWVKKLAYFSLTSEVITIAAVRDSLSGFITEFHIFSDALKPNVEKRMGLDIYTYSEYDRSYRVPCRTSCSSAGRW